jgi:Lrp/AsnC family transcriptional regulator
MMEKDLDLINRKILTELQRDATLPIATLAEKVGLSQTPCWKRVQKLEAAGVITNRVALVDQRKVGLGLTVLCEIEAMNHTPAWREQFLKSIEAFPEVIEVLRLGGQSDYMLRIVVPDMLAYDEIYRRLTEAVELKGVRSRFVMEMLHRKLSLPLVQDGRAYRTSQSLAPASRSAAE